MLHELTTQTRDGGATLRRASRSIDQILARRQARLSKREHIFPPDFLHGEARLDEIYAVFGECWVERALFVQEFYDDDGELVAWTAGWFDERFLTIEQAVRDEVDDLSARLEALKAEHRSIVRLSIDQPQADDEVELAVCCSLGRLLQLERERLAVVRDKEISDARAVYSQRDDVLQDSRTNMLSLVCLCARLAN